MVSRRIPRAQEIVIPYLKAQLAEDWPGVDVGSWVKDVDSRTYPYVNVRSIGGFNTSDLDLMRFQTIEVTAYGNKDLPDTENLLLDAQKCIWDMADRQVVTDKGHIHRVFTTMGMTQFDSPYDDSFRAQLLIQLTLRPPRG